MGIVISPACKGWAWNSTRPRWLNIVVLKTKKNNFIESYAWEDMQRPAEWSHGHGHGIEFVNLRFEFGNLKLKKQSGFVYFM